MRRMSFSILALRTVYTKNDDVVGNCLHDSRASPKLTLMATLIGEVHSNVGSRNSVCRLLRIFIAQNINIAY